MQNKKQFDELWRKTKEKTDLSKVEFKALYLSVFEGMPQRHIEAETGIKARDVCRLLKKYSLSPEKKPKTVRYSPKLDKDVIFKF
ncbi:hypothetical protein LCGC14_0972760 [marine sediment metagenome]|uniref:Uncharacterized protein n=1 Tax=marine sediment metagenome TaxID=412755 RepID=A0A0F9NFI1_9ZZZZ